MRILMGLHGLPPESVGGAEQTALTLARGLARTHRVLLFAPLLSPTFPAETERRWRETTTGDGTLEIVARKLSAPLSLEEGWANPDAEAWVDRLVSSFRPDLVHLHHHSHLSLRLLPRLQARGIPTVFTLHDFHTLCARGQLMDLDLKACAGPSVEGCARCLSDQLGLENRRGLPLAKLTRQVASHLRTRLPARLASPLEALVQSQLSKRPPPHPLPLSWQHPVATRIQAGREALEAATALVCPSRFMLEFMRSQGIPADKLHHIEQGLPDRLDHELLQAEPDLPPPLRVAYIGAMIPTKGVDLLLEAVRGLIPERISLTLVGPLPAFHRRPDFPAKLKSLTAEVGAVMLPTLAPGEVPAFLRSQHAVILPSIWSENAPVILREALREGVPVVASRTGGIPELVVAEVNGLLCEPGSSAALRQCLERLWTERGLYERLRQGAAKTNITTLEYYTNAVSRLYLSIASERSAN